MTRRLARWFWTSTAHPTEEQGFIFSRSVTRTEAHKLIRKMWVEVGPASRMPSGFKLNEPIIQLFRCILGDSKTVDGYDICAFTLTE